MVAAMTTDILPRAFQLKVIALHHQLGDNLFGFQERVPVCPFECKFDDSNNNVS